jgi:hypothetical protein
MSDQPSTTPSSTTPSTPAPASHEAALAQLRSTPAWSQRDHPQHAEVMAKISAIYEQQHPSETPKVEAPRTEVKKSETPTSPEAQAREVERQKLMSKDSPYWDKNHPQHAAAVQLMRQLARAEEIAESNEKKEVFTDKELAEDLEGRFGLKREPLPGIERTVDYDKHAADALSALADAGVAAPVVQELVGTFERLSVSNAGESLTDAQLDGLAAKFKGRIAQRTIDYMRAWYITSVRGGKR